MMPEMDGIELLRKMRQHSHVPFLFISAKSDDMDKINGLQLGADDYIGKPFNPLEVVSRVQALFRRADSYHTPEQREQELIEIGDVALDLLSCKLYKQGEYRETTSYEFKILALLMRNAGRVYTKAHIYEQVWGEEYMGDENLVMVYISKIRDKIEDNPRKPVHLVTIRGLATVLKKHNRHGGKRPLKRLFLLNYTAITGLVLAAIILALLNMDFLMNRFFDKTPDFKQISAGDLYEADGTLNGTLLNRYSGWLELLDEAGNVIATEGQKQDDIAAYSGDRLLPKSICTVMIAILPIILIRWKDPMANGTSYYGKPRN